MPSLNNMFGAPGSEADEDFDIDFDKLMGSVDTALKESSRLREPGMASEVDPEPEPEPEPVPEPQEEEDQPQGDSPAGHEEAEEVSAVESTTPPPIADPLGSLPPERRAALLAIDEVVQSDPAKRDRVLAALRDEAEAAPALPDDIEEGSVAARLWYESQETKRQLAEISSGQKAIAEETARQRAAQAAMAAGTEMGRRYPQLDNDDIVRIAQAAGSSGLAARLANGADDLTGAYVQAMETTMWTNEAFRTKATSEVASAEPTEADKDKAESKTRKARLNALSASASPSAAPPERKSALEARADGRLTPQSRLSVVGELAGKLSRERNEGMY